MLFLLAADSANQMELDESTLNMTVPIVEVPRQVNLHFVFGIASEARQVQAVVLDAAATPLVPFDLLHLNFESGTFDSSNSNVRSSVRVSLTGRLAFFKYIPHSFNKHTGPTAPPIACSFIFILLTVLFTIEFAVVFLSDEQQRLVSFLIPSQQFFAADTRSLYYHFCSSKVLLLSALPLT